jgi:hypothetical protein
VAKNQSRRNADKTTKGFDMKKKILVMAVLCGFCCGLFAQTGPTGSKPASSPVSPEMEAIQTAYSLARYGYANESASALIEAAEILAQTPTQPFAAQTERSGQTANSNKQTGTPEFTAVNLLADGKKFAAGNQTMLAWARVVEASLQSRTRGAVGGPKYQVDRVSANGTVTYSLPLRGNEYVEILCFGDGDTDIDLYLYNPNGSLNASDEGPSDACRLYGTTGPGGVYTLVVKNWGRVYNQFEIVTN